MRYEFTEEFMGITYQMLAEYNYIKGFAENETDPAEPDKVELVVVYMDRDHEDSTGMWVEFDSSEEYDEELRETILDSL